MNLNLLRQVLCGAFDLSTEGDTCLIGTPFQIDYNDRLVLRIRKGQGSYRVDDNGDTAFALMLAGVDTDPDRLSELVQLPKAVQIDSADSSLYVQAETLETAAESVWSITAHALRLHEAAKPRLRQAPSDFRDRVVMLLESIARQENVPILFDHVVEKTGSIIADVVIGSESAPLLVFAAPSPERLMEAELVYLRRKLHPAPGYVCAVVPSARAVGQKHFSRANYYTDKTLEFDGWDNAFGEFATRHLQSSFLQ
jgi:hypothetical protein